MMISFEGHVDPFVHIVFTIGFSVFKVSLSEKVKSKQKETDGFREKRLFKLTKL